MEIIKMLDEYRVRYNTEKNEGVIEDNGFSIEFSVDIYEGLVTKEPLDRHIGDKVYDLIFESIEYNKEKLFNDDEEVGRCDKEEGPYGGAFRDWDDYYIWKNGSLYL